jgi:hypothetical protein
MRILIKHLHVAVSRGIIQVEVILLHIFAVISFAVCESEETLLEDRIIAIPECQRKAKPTLFIANPSETIFTPSVGA